MGLLASPITAPTATATAKAMTTRASGMPTADDPPAPAATAAPVLAAAVLVAESLAWTASTARAAALLRRAAARTKACLRSLSSFSVAFLDAASGALDPPDTRAAAAEPSRPAPAAPPAERAFPLRKALRARTLPSMEADALAARAAASSPDDEAPSPPSGARAAAAATLFLSLRESLAASRLPILSARAPPDGC